MTDTIRVELPCTGEDIEGDAGDCTEEVELPVAWQICSDCGGEGSTLTESLRGAFTASEFEECFDDEESREEYFRGGRGAYGVPCKTCKGRTTVRVVDAERCDPELLARYTAWRDERAADDAADLATMRAECGYCDGRDG